MTLWRKFCREGGECWGLTRLVKKGEKQRSRQRPAEREGDRHAGCGGRVLWVGRKAVLKPWDRSVPDPGVNVVGAECAGGRRVGGEIRAVTLWIIAEL